LPKYSGTEAGLPFDSPAIPQLGDYVDKIGVFVMAKAPKKGSPVSEKLPSMLDALAAMNADGTAKGLAFKVLRQDLSQVKTESQFREAFAGIAALNQLLAPVHKSYAVAIEGMRKNLESYHRVHKWLLPDEVVTRIEASWKALCETFRKHLPVETWEQIEKTTVEAFSDVRQNLTRS